MGWLVGIEALCWWWESQAPAVVDISDHCLAGSGAAIFKQVFESSATFVETNCKNFERIDLLLCKLMAKLQAIDLESGRVTLQRSGYWFEAVQFDGRFKHVDNVTYSYWRLGRRDGVPVGLMPPLVINYRILPGWALVATYHLGSSDVTDTYFHLATEPGAAEPEIDLTQIASYPLGLAHQCWSFRALHDDGRTASATIISGADNTLCRIIRGPDGRDRFDVQVARIFDDLNNPGLG